MSKKRPGARKTQAEVRQYKDFIAKSSYSPEGTTPQTNSMLQGSGEYSDERGNLHGQEDVLKTPLRYRIWDWIRKNLIAEIIVTVIIAIGTATISHTVKIAVIEQRLEYVEKQIDLIDERAVNKDYLESQVELIKTDLSGTNKLNLNDIEWKLKDIEKRLEDIEKE